MLLPELSEGPGSARLKLRAGKCRAIWAVTTPTKSNGDACYYALRMLTLQTCYAFV